MSKRLYVAYGSNLNLSQMNYRCPEARKVGTSVIKDYQLLFKGSFSGNYLTIEPKEGYEVPVGIWEVTEYDERRLDSYEGFPDFYYKKDMILPVKYESTGEVVEENVFVYIMHEERKLGIPRDYYVETCLEGYKNFGFDTKYLYQAIEDSSV